MATKTKLVKESEAVTKVIKDADISEKVLSRVTELEEDGKLDFPQNYSYANALKSAWLLLQETKDKSGNLVLNTCSKQSIANSLLDMVVQGLSPAKKQCYFIAYGKSLQLSRSYLGTIAVTKRLEGIKDVFAQVIYQGDEFEYTIDPQTGLKRILKHTQNLDNIDNGKIKGAYALVIREDADSYVEIMTMEQIKKAWNQGATKGKSPAHTNFPEEMAKKSVINRACKMFFNVSNDSDTLIESINRSIDAENGMDETRYEEVIENEIKENANKQEIDVEVEEESGGLTEEEKREIEMAETEAVKVDRGF